MFVFALIHIEQRIAYKRVTGDVDDIKSYESSESSPTTQLALDPESSTGQTKILKMTSGQNILL